MRVLAAASLLFAACDTGVVLEVRPDPSIPTDRVNLFIGLSSCDDCPGIAPPDAKATVKREILPGDVYFLEADAVVRTANVENGVARFRVEASELSDHLKIAVAVDANEQSAALIQNISLDSAGVYRVDLKKATQTLGPRPNAAHAASVAIWPQPMGSLTCLGFERWESGTLAGPRVFIVPESDPDCDAVPESKECAPLSYLATSVPTLEEVTCMTLDLDTDGGACKLAGPSCNEMSGTRETCSPSDYCLPTTFCAGSTVCPGGDLLACLFDTQAPPTAMLKCTIPFKPTGELCTSSFTFSLANMGSTCVGLEKMLLSRPMALPLQLDDVAKFSSRAINDSLHMLQITMRHESGCTYKVGLSGDLGAGAQVFDKHTVFAAFAASNGGPLRKALVPIELTPANDCVSLQASCTLAIDASDSIGKCLSR